MFQLLCYLSVCQSACRWPVTHECPCAATMRQCSKVGSLFRRARLSVLAGSEKRTRAAEEGDPGSPSKRLKMARQMSLGTVLRHVESQGQARGSLDSHVGAKPITVEDMTGEGPERRPEESCSCTGRTKNFPTYSLWLATVRCFSPADSSSRRIYTGGVGCICKQPCPDTSLLLFA